MAKILLVEDDKSLREIYGVRLMAEGYEIVSAGDGEEALAMAIKERPDLIVSDVMMPKISGFDMLDILRSTTETKNVKVIMMTALSSEDQRARGESLGADRYLVKSQVGIEDVVRTVHDVLGDGVAAPTPAPVFPAAAPVAAVAEPAQEAAPAFEAPAAVETPVTSFTPVPDLPEAQPAPAPIEAPVFPEPVVETYAPVPELPPQPAAEAAPAFTAPAEQPAAPAFDTPAPAAAPFEAPAYESAPAAPVFPSVPPAPTVAPTEAPASVPAFTQPAQPASFTEAPAAPAFPPTAAPVAAPAPVSLPQPTAPFSTPAPASLGERVISPLTDANSGNVPSVLDISSQIEQALNTPGSAQTPQNQQNPTV